MKTKKELKKAIKTGRVIGPIDRGYGSLYYWEANGTFIASGQTPEECRGKAIKFLKGEIKRFSRPPVFPLKAPYTYKIGNSAKVESAQVLSPIITKMRVKILRWAAGKITKGEKPITGSPLWYSWFYDSDRPDFPWIKWAMEVSQQQQNLKAGGQART